MKKNLFFLFLIPAIFAAAQEKKSNTKTVTVYTTADQTTLRLAENGVLSFKEKKQPLETEPAIFIEPTISFQTFIGIGGALTDASAEVFAKLPKVKQAELLKAYYDKKDGIGYTIARTNMNSCDFSSDTYTYVTDNDINLKSFNVKHDQQFKIPLIKQAMKAAGGKLSLFISPWSPPAWMKDNNDMLHGGKLKQAFAQSWANYYVKFINAYQAQGIPVWGLTVQNEPMAKQRWESCIFTAEEERDFIKKFLGPTLQKNGMATKKLIAWDHNRDLMFQRASVILKDPQAAKYVWGIGFHWYETWTGGPMLFENVKCVSQAFPNTHLIFTEGCKEKFNLDSVNNWSLGERYGSSILNDLNNGTAAWTDWNILLDEKGGPNHVGNLCFAPIHADTRTGELIYTNAYQYIGHFSKFIQPGAKRIAAASSRAQLQSTAFKNPDGTIVVIVLNLTNRTQSYHLCINGDAALAESLPHSISTLIIK